MSGGVDPGGDPALRRTLAATADVLLAAHRPVTLHDLLATLGGTPLLDEGRLQRLGTALRDSGYLDRALTVARELHGRVPTANVARRLALIEGEIAALELAAQAASAPRDAGPPPTDVRPGKATGPVLHVVGTSLPGVVSSYTRRTQLLALQQSARGLAVVVATAAGFGVVDAGDPTVADVVDGVTYRRLAGPARGEVPLDEWLRTCTDRLGELVAELRPAVLHAASDWTNALVAGTVARAAGIPLVYEVRGFWQDSWFERQRERYAWPEQDVVAADWGLPDVLTRRRAAEAGACSRADRVVAVNAAVLDRVVADGTPRERVVLLGDPTDDAACAALYDGLDVDVLQVDVAHVDVAAGPTELDALCAWLRERGHVPPEPSMTSGSGEDAARTMTEGWSWAGRPLVRLDLPLDWYDLLSDHRSHAFQLHAWEFMGPLLGEYAAGRGQRYLDWCLERAVSWAEAFDAGHPPGTMAWYDMALALRAPRLAFLLQEAVLTDADPAVVSRLASAAVRHRDELLAPGAFNPRNNHGFYTAVGQLTFARRLSVLPGMAAVQEQGRARLEQVCDGQFAPDGAHLEHSPDYHRMLLDSFDHAIGDGVVEDPEILARIDLAAEALGWFTRPDGTLVQIGDSPERVVAARSASRRSARTSFLTSRGRQGVPSDTTLRVFPDAGYAIVRSPQPVGTDDHLDASYLTLMAGFHSRTHKHADDLSLTWFDAGEELLIDSGRFGYLDQLPADSPDRLEGFYYSRPERQYVERTRAHCTVEADGRDHDRRSRVPYGSALRDTQERDGHYRLTAEVTHGAWTHRREVALRPGRWLLVTDRMVSDDSHDHDFRVWWNLGDRLSLASQSQSQSQSQETVRFDLDCSDTSLWVENLDGAELLAPVQGGTDPMRGWRSRQDYTLTPTWSLALTAPGVRAATVRTLLSLGGAPLGAAPAHPFEG